MVIKRQIILYLLLGLTILTGAFFFASVGSAEPTITPDNTTNNILSADSVVTVVITPTVDSYVQENFPNFAMWPNPDMYMGNETFLVNAKGITRPYLHFELPNIPADAVITDAQINLVKYTSNDPGARTHYESRTCLVLEDWWSRYELYDALTWNRQPAMGTEEDCTPWEMKAYGSIFVQQLTQWNILPHVSAWRTGTSNHGVRIEMRDETLPAVVFCSTDANFEDFDCPAPTMVLTYTLGTVTVPTIEPITHIDGRFTLNWVEDAYAIRYELEEQFNNGEWTMVERDETTISDDMERENGEWCYRVRTLYAGDAPTEWSDVQCVTIAEQRVLHVVLLAFDTPITHTASLAPLYIDVIDALKEATANDSAKTAVILSDFGGNGDTFIWEVMGGDVTDVRGLVVGTALSSTSYEVDMADGETIGNFIRWARDSYSSDRTIVSYAGHGSALIPETATFPWTEETARQRSASTPPLQPLPSWLFIDPAMTDTTSGQIITPYDLHVAMQIATNDGADPIDVLDIAHCFAATIEELYAITEDSTAVEIIIGSTSYAYLPPTVFGDTLAQISNNDRAPQIAAKLMAEHERLLHGADQTDDDPDVDHPRTLVAVWGNQIKAVKEAVDALAADLHTALQTAPTATRDRLHTAYEKTTTFYDTSYCPPHDWNVASPDALVDINGLMAQIANQFDASDPNIANRARQVSAAASAAVITHNAQAGSPWFANNNAVFWPYGTMATDDAIGIGLYADFEGISDGATHLLSWQWNYYSDTENRPYAFLRNSTTGVSWADVLTSYWQVRNVEEGITVQAQDCMFPELASPTQEAELSVPHVLLSDVNLGYVNTPIQLSSLIRTDSGINKLFVQFSVMDETAEVYSDTVVIAHISVGMDGYTNHYVETNVPWTPDQSGTYTLTVTVDPDNRFVEQNETDNQETVSIIISDESAAEFDPFLMGGGQLITQTVASLDGLSTDSYEIDIYQYQYDSSDDTEDNTLQRPIQTADITPLNSNQFDFSTARPGLMTLHVWAKSDTGEPLHQPQILHLNYAPPEQAIARDETHYFWYRVEEEDTGRTISFDFEAVTGSASLLVWTPFDVWSADSSSGGGLSFTARPGQYLVQVKGTSAGTTYTFNIIHDRTATTRSALNKQSLNAQQIRRATFVYPYPQGEAIPLAVEMSAADHALPKMIPAIPLSILIICITLLGRFTITRRKGQAC